MSGHSTYQPQNAFMRWMERRLPIAGLVYSSFIVYPTPRNLNYWWTFGGILTFMLAAQIVTGVVLACTHATRRPGFNSVEQIMRDQLQLAAAYLRHGASMFFLAAYIPHVSRHVLQLLQGAARVLWILGVILLLLMIMTGHRVRAATGPDELLGATVIHQPVLAIPLVVNPS